MPFPRKLLIESEELVLELRPHWIALVMPAIVTILVIVGWSLAVANGPDSGTGHDAVFWGATAVAIFVLIWFPVRKFIAWVTSYFVVTSDRVIHREGWIAKRSMEIPLEAINDVRFHQGVFERMIGAGDLKAAAGGEGARNGCDVAGGFRIDWIAGSHDVQFSNYREDKSGLVAWMTDHPVMVTDVTIDAANFPKSVQN